MVDHWGFVDGVKRVLSNSTNNNLVGTGGGGNFNNLVGTGGGGGSGGKVVVGGGKVLSNNMSKNGPTSVVLEIGSGTGYVASVLQESGGIDVLATDLVPTESTDQASSNGGGAYSGAQGAQGTTHRQSYHQNSSASGSTSGWNEYHGNLPCWLGDSESAGGGMFGRATGIQTGQARAACVEALSGEAAWRKYKSDCSAVLMCYPPPGDKLAENVAKKMVDDHASNSKVASRTKVQSAEILILIGEFGGDTGTIEFERFLVANFSLIEEIALPNFVNTCYSCTVWRVKKTDYPTTTGVSAASASDDFQLPRNLQCCLCGKPNANVCRKGTKGEFRDGVRLYRDRLTRAVLVCEKCFATKKATGGCANSKDSSTLDTLLESELKDRGLTIPERGSAAAGTAAGTFRHADLWRLLKA